MEVVCRNAGCGTLRGLRVMLVAFELGERARIAREAGSSLRSE